MTAVSALIRTRRVAAGLTQSALARRITVADAHVSRWERGLFAPSPRYAARLAEALGGTPSDYLDFGEAGK